MLAFPPAAEAKKLNVVTSTTDMAALAQEVGGDKINGRVHRQGLSGPALRGSQAQLPAQAAKGGPADRGRAATGNRLAAAADHAERQSAHPGGRGRAIWTPRSSPRSWRSPGDRSRAPWATCIRWAIRTTGWIPITAAASREASRNKLGEMRPRRRRIFQQRFQDFDQPPDRRREELGRRHEAVQADGRWLPITAPGPTSPSTSAWRWSATSSPGRAFRPRPAHTLEIIQLMKRDNVKVVAGRTLLRSEDPDQHRQRHRSARWWCCCPRWEARKR